MALITRTTQQALIAANVRLSALETDARLDSAEQALCGELRQQNILALNAMNPSGIIPGGQRNARAQAIEDKVFALGNVCKAHQSDITIDEFYNALDLSTDTAGAIREGVGSFVSDLGSGL